MHEVTLNTPALLFPTISLLLLAYTNRYIAISNRIRSLHTQYQTEKSAIIIDQISILKKRIFLIRNMQLLGIATMFISALSMFLIFYNLDKWVYIVFGLSLITMLLSLALCAVEVYLSNKALLIQIKDVEHLIDQ
jgi:hypothetical protein